MQVLLAKGNSFLSKLILFFSKGNFSHIALRYPPPNEDILIHAYWYGVVPEFFNYFLKKYKSYEIYECTFKYADEALICLTQNIEHKGYDFTSLFISFINLILKTRIKGYRYNNYYNCVEVFCEFVKICKYYDEQFDIDDFEIETPKDVRDALSKSKYFVRIK